MVAYRIARKRPVRAKNVFTTVKIRIVAPKIHFTLATHLLQSHELRQCLGVFIKETKPVLEELTALLRCPLAPGMERVRGCSDCLHQIGHRKTTIKL